MTAGTSLDTVQTADDGRALTRRVPRQPRQLLVCIMWLPWQEKRTQELMLYSSSASPGQHAPEASGSSPFRPGLLSLECCMLMQNLDHPELIITWGSDFPDKLKIRKEIPLWPFRFKLRADYSRALRAFEYGCSCKVRRGGAYCCAVTNICCEYAVADGEVLCLYRMQFLAAGYGWTLQQMRSSTGQLVVLFRIYAQPSA